MTRAFLIGALIPAKYWIYLVYDAIYTINSLPTPVLQQQSPFEVFFQKMPNYFSKTFWLRLLSRSCGVFSK